MPIIDSNSRRDAELKVQLLAEAERQKLLNFDYAEQVRSRESTTVEGASQRAPEDEFGKTSSPRAQRGVRGNAKLKCHLTVRHRSAGRRSDSETDEAANLALGQLTT